MRVAVIVGSFPEISETFILNQIVAMTNQGWQVDIFAHQQINRKAKIQEDVLQYHFLDKTAYLPIPKNRWERIKRFVSLLLRFGFTHFDEIMNAFRSGGLHRHDACNQVFRLEAFLEKNYDLIHCHFGTIAENYIFLKEVYPQTKFVVSFHGYDVLQAKRKKGFDYQRVLNQADVITAPSLYIMRQLEVLGAETKKLQYLPNGVNTDKFSPKQNGKTRDFKRITTVARLVPEKNITFALETIFELKKQTDIPFKYTLIGNGILLDDIRNQIKSLNLENEVELMAECTHEEIIQLLRESDVFFLSSKNEAFGLALIEAQAMELPVVAVNIGGISEAVMDEHTGFLLKEHDIQLAKGALAEFLNKPDLKDQFGKSGREFVLQNFDLAKVNQRFITFFKELV